MTFVATLEPQALWRHFDHILTIPRGSTDEGRMRDYVLGLAARHGLDHTSDAAGNIVVRKPAQAGAERAPIVVLQSHLDMVNEKDSGVEHDFRRDPIRPRRDGAYLAAEGTTLGSDNGIGVAAMLAVLEDRGLAHGPLELLFTIDEETGLTGASELAADMLKGRLLINLDSEEQGALYVGCAGGGGSTLTLPLVRAAVGSRAATFEVVVSGLRGGHSGVDIHLQRGNAVKILVRALHAALLERPFVLAALAGGSAHNAIPREARAVAVAAAGDAAALRGAVEADLAESRAELRRSDPDLAFAVTDTATSAEAWDPASTARAVRLLAALPHGVLAMSHDIPGLVETSVNVAKVAEGDGTLEVAVSTRSSVASALAAHRRSVRALATLAGAEVEEAKGYPGWQPNLESSLLGAVQRVQERVLGSKAEIKAIHAGLECGIIGEKFPGMDMISFGPQIEFPHSPGERVEITSVETFDRLLRAVLEELATGAS